MHKEHLLPGDFSIVWQLGDDSWVVHECLLLYAHILCSKICTRHSMLFLLLLKKVSQQLSLGGIWAKYSTLILGGIFSQQQECHEIQGRSPKTELLTCDGWREQFCLWVLCPKPAMDCVKPADPHCQQSRWLFRHLLLWSSAVLTHHLCKAWRYCRTFCQNKGTF